MVALINILTQTETLLESDMLRVLIAAYLYVFVMIFACFLNIYSVDKHEFLNHTQNCIYFKHKMFFVIMYSKEKRIVSKKTLITELIGYLISLAAIVVFICSLKQDVTTALILLGIVSLCVYVFGWVTGGMYRKTKKYK